MAESGGLDGVGEREFLSTFHHGQGPQAENHYANSRCEATSNRTSAANCLTVGDEDFQGVRSIFSKECRVMLSSGKKVTEYHICISMLNITFIALLFRAPIEQPPMW